MSGKRQRYDDEFKKNALKTLLEQKEYIGDSPEWVK